MKRIIYILIVLIYFGIGGCENDEYLYCDVSSRIWLGRTDTIGNLITVSDSCFFSFMLSDSKLEEHMLYVVANVSGQAAMWDRPITLEVVEEKTNVPASCFDLGMSFMPANAFKTNIPVIIKKNVPGMDLQKEVAYVTFRIIPNDYFLVGDSEMTEFKVVWCDFLARPESWTYWITTYLGPFSQARYKFIIDNTGIIEFDRYESDFNGSQALVSELRKLLAAYNADSSNVGRPEGWPYKDDDGSDLTF